MYIKIVSLIFTSGMILMVASEFLKFFKIEEQLCLSWLCVLSVSASCFSGVVIGIPLIAFFFFYFYLAQFYKKRVKILFKIFYFLNVALGVLVCMGLPFFVLMYGLSQKLSVYISLMFAVLAVALRCYLLNKNQSFV